MVGKFADMQIKGAPYMTDLPVNFDTVLYGIIMPVAIIITILVLGWKGLFPGWKGLLPSAIFIAAAAVVTDTMLRMNGLPALLS